MKRAKLINAAVLWLGMYAITCGLFWFKTGSIRTGLGMGLVSATLKTIWSATHHRYLSHQPVIDTDTLRV